MDLNEVITGNTDIIQLRGADRGNNSVFAQTSTGGKQETENNGNF